VERMSKKNFFTRVNLILIGFAIPILLLFVYYNRVSVGVVEDVLQRENVSQLEFLRDQIDSAAEGLMVSSIMIIRDPNVQEVEKYMMEGNPKQIREIGYTIVEKLRLQSAANAWFNEITVHFPQVEQVLSTIDPVPSFSGTS
jgi:two-component system, sensor histidine kinase YesM